MMNKSISIILLKVKRSILEKKEKENEITRLRVLGSNL